MALLRFLHWVLEVVEPDGKSHVHGVYTSIPDLVDRGFHGDASIADKDCRLTLVQLDSAQPPLGTWFASVGELERDLEPFVASGEIDRKHCDLLIKTVRERGKVAS